MCDISSSVTYVKSLRLVYKGIEGFGKCLLHAEGRVGG